MMILFACVALLIFLLTAKRLALVSSITFFISEWVANLNPEAFVLQASIVSMMVIHLSAFTIAVVEYRKHRTPLSRSLMWLYLSAMCVIGSYSIGVTDTQGHILWALSVVELSILMSMDGCRSVWTDFRLTADTIRTGSYRQRRHTHREG